MGDAWHSLPRSFAATEYTVNVKADGKLTKYLPWNKYKDCLHAEIAWYHETQYVVVCNLTINYVMCLPVSSAETIFSPILDKQVDKQNTTKYWFNLTCATGKYMQCQYGKLTPSASPQTTCVISKVGAGAVPLAALHPLGLSTDDPWQTADIAAGYLLNYRNVLTKCALLNWRYSRPLIGRTM